MAPLKEEDIKKVQGLARKWAARRKLQQLKREYLFKIARKYTVDITSYPGSKIKAKLFTYNQTCFSQPFSIFFTFRKFLIAPDARSCVLFIWPDLRKPTANNVESGPPLFSDAQMNQIYNDPTPRVIDCTFVDTVDRDELPKKYQG